MDMRQKIAEGGRLSVVLTPNHDALARSEPEYNECYALPFVYFEDDVFAGMTRPAHTLVEDGGVDSIGFCYTNGLPFYSIVYPSSVGQKLAPNQIAVKLMSISHYRRHEFVLRPPGSLVFESRGAGEDVERLDHGLRDSIEQGCSHYMVVDLGGGALRSTPIDIAYDYFPTGAAEFRSEGFLVSSHTVMPKTFREHLLSVDADIGAKMLDPAFAHEIATPCDTTYLRVGDDGSCRTAKDEHLGEARPCQGFKVFAQP